MRDQPPRTDRRYEDGQLERPCYNLPRTHPVSRYQLTWRPSFGGKLALGHKPGKRLRAQLEDAGCTLVVNLLSERESRAKVGPHRIRLPLISATPPGPERDEEVRALFRAMSDELGRGGKVYVHCSAGLHRTGMIAYAFFRHRGMSAEGARATIHALRELTASELTEERCAWGDRFASVDAGGPEHQDDQDWSSPVSTSGSTTTNSSRSRS